MGVSLSSLMKMENRKHVALVSRISSILATVSESLDFMVKEFKVTEVPGRPNENKITYHVEVTHDRTLNRCEYDLASILAYEFAELYLLPKAGNVVHIERSISFKLKE